MSAVRWRAAFVAASIGWAVLLVAVPFVARQPHVSAMPAALIAAVYAAGSLVCHQLPERWYHLWTVQMPVCARCAGIYAGAVLGASAGAIRTAKAGRHRRKVAQGLSPADAVARNVNPAWQPRLALAAAVAPTIVTLVYEWTTGVRPSHEIRAAAGVPLGVVVAWLIVAATDNQVD